MLMRPTWPTEPINRRANEATKTDEADEPTRPTPMTPMRPMHQWFDEPDANNLMGLIWPNEAVAANVSDGADASVSAWADMADANKNNDGKFDFCGTKTSSSSITFWLSAFSRSPSRNIAKLFLKWRDILVSAVATINWLWSTLIWLKRLLRSTKQIGSMRPMRPMWSTRSLGPMRLLESMGPTNEANVDRCQWGECQRNRSWWMLLDDAVAITL